MRICIYGAGAIGGYLGVQLALAGQDVTLIARGPHLEAMRANGLKLLIGDEERIAHPRCTDDPSEAGPQDYVIVTLKAHSVPRVVDAMQPLLGPDTAVVSLLVSQKMRAFVSNNDPDDLVALGEMGAAGSLTPAIERVFPFEAGIGAIRHVSGGHTRGKVVISMQ